MRENPEKQVHFFFEYFSGVYLRKLDNFDWRSPVRFLSEPSIASTLISFVTYFCISQYLRKPLKSNSLGFETNFNYLIEKVNIKKIFLYQQYFLTEEQLNFVFDEHSDTCTHITYNSTNK